MLEVDFIAEGEARPRVREAKLKRAYGMTGRGARSRFGWLEGLGVLGSAAASVLPTQPLSALSTGRPIGIYRAEAGRPAMRRT